MCRICENLLYSKEMGKNSQQWKRYQGKNERRPGKHGGGRGNSGNREQNGDGFRRGDDGSAERSKGSVDLAELQASEAWGCRFECNAPKRKYAVCFGYLGSAYHGLQLNPGSDTIERQLERALFLAGGIQESNFGFLQKLSWSRAARTDKGVHASAQCCAMRLSVPITGHELITEFERGVAREPVPASSLCRVELHAQYKDLDLAAAEVQRQRAAFVARVNTYLPPDIRMHTLTKVTKNYNAKNMCDKRRYHYLLPTYLVQPRSQIQGLLQTLFEEQGPLPDAGREGGWALTGQTTYLGKPFLERAHAGELVSGYRICQKQLDALRSACKLFEGTHKFHNYTTGKAPTDASSTRYIISFSVGDPFVSNIGGMEWVLLTIVGQSFLLNQIRKMVGMVCEVASGATGAETLSRTLSNSKVECPMMPGLGLYLDELFFDGYNHKMKLENKSVMRKAQNGSANSKGRQQIQNMPTATLPIKSEVESAISDNGNDEQCVKRQKLDSDASFPAEAPVAHVVPDVAAVAAEGDGDTDLVHEFLEWGKDEFVQQQWQQFRSTCLWPHVCSEEASSLAFLFYLDSLRVYPRKYISYPFVIGKKNKDVKGEEEEEEGGGEAQLQAEDGAEREQEGEEMGSDDDE